MDKVWGNAKKAGNLVKFGGGFYAGKLPRWTRCGATQRRPAISSSSAVASTRASCRDGQGVGQRKEGRQSRQVRRWLLRGQAAEMDKVWGNAKKAGNLVKFGGGF